ncbi:hypothetical protein EYR40_004433 [Pleurotus pulmonarius]|nr:hypothetical protein EYR40_004433 [Pleurotus pulmonarius]KAF4607134.1 hypothetical protein EYR38_001193 [Pleurotus pulmonarius]
MKKSDSSSSVPSTAADDVFLQASPRTGPPGQVKGSAKAQDISRIVPEVIELSDSSPEASPRVRKKPQGSPSKKGKLPLFIDDSEESSDDDGAIMTFDEPPSARKPLKLPLEKFSTLDINDTPPSSPKKRKVVSATRRDATLVETPTTSTSTSVKSTSTSTSTSTPSSISVTRTGLQATRVTKKAQAAADLTKRKNYAEDLFKELNALVFDRKLPPSTQLTWSKRLTTTAGRAKWHKSAAGVHTTEIELAEKILDCEERIRNTLSHEMCHLACWVIDGCPKEGHGQLFKAWSAKVMLRRPEIHISTRHDYEISYPYQWECEKCAKIYGRFSKSIRPDECVCGACRVGRLRPLFKTNQRAPRTPKVARMAAAKPQDSPKSLPRSHLKFSSSSLFIDLTESYGDDAHGEVLESPVKEQQILCQHGSDSEDEGVGEEEDKVEILATIVESVSLAYD